MFSSLKFVERLVIYFKSNDWKKTINTSCLKSEPEEERLVSHAEICTSLEWPKHGRIGSVGKQPRSQTRKCDSLGNNPFSHTLSCGK